MFDHLVHDGVRGTVMSWVPPVVHVKENGNYLIQGVRLVDEATRHRLSIPNHEDAVEVSKSAILALL